MTEKKFQSSGTTIISLHFHLKAFLKVAVANPIVLQMLLKLMQRKASSGNTNSLI